MIGKMQGIVDHIGTDYVIIMAGSVGYKVFCPEYLSLKSTVSLWIETVVREDSIRLFGFTALSGLELFNQLTTVSGVGPKVAMAILGTLKPEVLLTAIATGDAKTISSAPGVGKKVAEKIIVELKSKTGNVSLGLDMGGGNNLADLWAALEALGYRRVDIIEIAQKLADENPSAGVEKLVPMALKQISSK
ncbi:MAG: Holliday junction branch migration protein RuvA [Rickettsiales bacterium]|jgi:Holliday junction DNA helicase RuvA|nr:Holliday junction branch migration protein RuvA [Rickettsiales bacterium]